MHFVVIIDGLYTKNLSYQRFNQWVKSHHQKGNDIRFNLIDAFPNYVEVQAIITTKSKEVD